VTITPAADGALLVSGLSAGQVCLHAAILLGFAALRTRRGDAK
jgi:hypothetical protein